MKILELLNENKGYTAFDVADALNNIMLDEQPNLTPIEEEEITPELLQRINADIEDIEMEAEYGESEDTVEGLRLDLWFNTIKKLRPEFEFDE